MRVLRYVVIGAVGLVWPAAVGWADTISKGVIESGDNGWLSTRTTTPGVIANGSWVEANDLGGFKISWAVHQDPSTRYWTYSYTVANADGSTPIHQMISHLIIEVSSNFTSNNVKSVEGKYAIDTWTDKGNPGLPTPFFGLKFDSDRTTYTLVTDRLPMWGSFFAKGGKYGQEPNWAHNTGLGSLGIDRYSNSNGLALIAVPDTVGPDTQEPPPVPVPLPASAFGGLALLSGLGLVRRMRRHPSK